MMGFRIENDEYTPEYYSYIRTVTGFEVSRTDYMRETERRTYSTMMSPGSSSPAYPVNPGNLSPVGAGENRWHCAHRSSPDPEPGKYVKYTEVWEKCGKWIKINVQDSSSGN